VAQSGAEEAAEALAALMSERDTLRQQIAERRQRLAAGRQPGPVTQAVVMVGVSEMERSLLSTRGVLQLVTRVLDWLAAEPAAPAQAPQDELERKMAPIRLDLRFADPAHVQQVRQWLIDVGRLDRNSSIDPPQVASLSATGFPDALLYAALIEIQNAHEILDEQLGVLPLFGEKTKAALRKELKLVKQREEEKKAAER